MTSPLRRTTAILAAAAIALLLASCGVDAGDDAAPSSGDGAGDRTTTTAADSPDEPDEPDEELTDAEQEAVDRVKDLYVDLGMDPEDAECLAEGIAGSVETLDPSDAGQMMDIINECDISMGELNELGKDQGLTSMEDGIKYGLESSLQDLGLTEEQAACVADAYVDEYGSDVTKAQDPEAIRPIFESCDVDPSLIGG